MSIEVFVAIVCDKHTDDRIGVFSREDAAVRWAREGYDEASDSLPPTELWPFRRLVWGCTDGMGDYSARVERCVIDGEN